ncbi:hypothetical protein IFM89_030611 [Coptis chinensis]|uniref:Uncharacterized protein n=1 Tax=Coptis chinensis TaxID=261450 RepID=A0A835LNZ6_9MAGN|nr:hypothetical protein IFM89_030611 [Coptis chinensis]
MTRRCSHCSNNGHNSRTCPNRGVKLFGVRLTDGSIRKSASMGNLSHYNNGNSNSVGSGLSQLGGGGNNNHLSSSPGDTPEHGVGGDDGGYASEDFVKGSSSSCRERKKERRRKAGEADPRGVRSDSKWDGIDKGNIRLEKGLKERKEVGNSGESFVLGLHLFFSLWACSVNRAGMLGVPWTEEEHRMFLLGLQKLGKGDWRGIARNYVISRTPTQVASHAQKHFIRQTNMSRRKRRSSLFDITADEQVDTPQVLAQDLFPISHLQAETPGNPSLAATPAIDEECESMDSTNSNDGEAGLPNPESSQCSYPVIFPAFVSPFFPFSFPFWPGYTTEPMIQEAHEVVKPTAVHSKSPINVDELVGMSKLSLEGESIGNSGSSSLSRKLVEGTARQSAFHVNPTTSSSSMKSSKSTIHAV